MFVAFSLVFINGCLPREESVNQETQDNRQQNEFVVRTYFEQVWNRGRIDLLDTLLTNNYINHTPSVKNADPGIAGLKSIVVAIRKGFPDLHYKIEDIISTDERVVVRAIMTGTHTDTLFNLAPTRRPIKVNQINIERIDAGRISEHWRVTDELEMMKQLGFVK